MTRPPHSHHSPEFKEQALLKARHRGRRSVISVAGELNMSAGTQGSGCKAQARKPALQPSRCSLQLLHWTARRLPGRPHSV